MKVLFLDIDGVLNGHEKHPDSPYTTIRPDCVRRLNRVIKATDCKIVISSAWRYMVLRTRKNEPATMTLLGFQYLLHTHGLMTHSDTDWSKIIVGHTCPDEDIPERSRQILNWVASRMSHSDQWAAVDDMDFRDELGRHAGRLVVTDATRGLRDKDARRLSQLLGK